MEHPVSVHEIKCPLCTFWILISFPFLLQVSHNFASLKKWLNSLCGIAYFHVIQHLEYRPVGKQQVTIMFWSSKWLITIKTSLTKKFNDILLLQRVKSVSMNSFHEIFLLFALMLVNLNLIREISDTKNHFKNGTRIIQNYESDSHSLANLDLIFLKIMKDILKHLSKCWTNPSSMILTPFCELGPWLFLGQNVMCLFIKDHLQFFLNLSLNSMCKCQKEMLKKIVKVVLSEKHA